MERILLHIPEVDATRGDLIVASWGEQVNMSRGPETLCPAEVGRGKYGSGPW